MATWEAGVLGTRRHAQKKKEEEKKEMEEPQGHLCLLHNYTPAWMLICKYYHVLHRFQG